MAHEEGQEADHLSENWFSNFEDQCLEELDSEPNMEESLQRERDLNVQNLWIQFQNSATAIAQLYKDRHNELSVWIPFQNAASSVTTLYKDSVETIRRYVDLGIQTGRQNRTKDIVSWVRKKRKHIRREELLAYLCGKNPPPRSRLPSSCNVARHTQSPRLAIDRPISRFNTPESLPTSDEPDLEAFRQAIALQGLNGAMSNISVGFQPHSTHTKDADMEELNTFILDEFSRHCDHRRKRSSTPDVSMDSPSRKKSRLL
ncbi:hypothetical protein CHS0354_028344 [Potamilus streckersoni]|uniref:Uncharacterized protein n=1 Tax=Potamilus streckersoni TaxID=2493646 RepID=A0AAE0RTW6_9BIVA|nr:hypothetical protein CHS0354_028344 [Potamilus streckersoni]